MFGRQPVVDEDDGDPGLGRHFGAHVVMRLATAEHPAAAVEIDDPGLSRSDPGGLKIRTCTSSMWRSSTASPAGRGARNARHTSSQPCRCSASGQFTDSGGLLAESSW